MKSKTNKSLNTGFEGYFKEIGEYPLVSAKEEKSLCQIMQHGTEQQIQEAKNKLIEGNLRLVVKLANFYRGAGMEFEDIIAEGNGGLVHAAIKFDPSRGSKFSVYASVWIKQRITRALCNSSRLIRLPVYLVQDYRKINKFIIEFKEHNAGQEPSEPKIAEGLEMSEARTKRAIEAHKESNSIFSLDQTIAPHCEGEEEPHGNGGGKHGLIEDELNPSPLAHAEQMNEFDLIKKFLNKLPERERLIVQRRYGLGNRDEETLENIGSSFNITRERVRQIEKVAMTKLKVMFRRQTEAHI